MNRAASFVPVSQGFKNMVPKLCKVGVHATTKHT